MRIAIDLQSCQSGSRLGGIGRYSLELAKAMVREHSSKHEFWLVLSNALPGAEAEIRYAFANLLPQDRIRAFEVPRHVSGYGTASGKIRAAELIREAFIADLAPDVLHLTSLIEGFREDVVTSVGRFFPSERTAVTLYDLIPLVQRERYLQDRRIRSHYLEKVEQLKEAGLLLAISEFSRQEAIDLLTIDPEHVVNISSAADERFRPLVMSPQEASNIRKHYGISNNYLMYTGSFDVRKNHENLIKAFALLPSGVRRSHQLLIVGNGWDAVYQQLREIGKNAGLADGDLVFAGHVADADLPALYGQSSLFVFPSLAEGFGLPVLEAMACGTPTICSNCTSLPEVIGLDTAQFDPRSPQSIADVMHRALTDAKFSAMLSSHGIAQAKNFSWSKSARRAVGAMEQLGARLKRPTTSSAIVGIENSAIDTRVARELIRNLAALEGMTEFPDAAVRELAGCLAANRQQIDVLRAALKKQRSDLCVGWVTTWNTRCGIAAYSRFLIDRFHADNIIFAPHAQVTIEPDGHNVVRCWESEQSDTLEKLFNEVRARNVEVLIIQFNYGFFDFRHFRKLVERVNAAGIRLLVTFHSTNDPSDDKRLAYLAGELSDCYALLVHNQQDIKTLSKLGLGHNTLFLPQGVVNIEHKSVAAPSLVSKTVVGTYGFALPGKGLMEVVEAFGILRERSKLDLHLLMLNAEYPAPQSAQLIAALKSRLQQLGLSEAATIVPEYLPDAESLGHLRQASLVVYAYQKTGESSSAAVRMALAAQRPVAVTPLAIFDDLGDAVFRFDGTTPEKIAVGIEAVLAHLSSKDEAALQAANSASAWRLAHDYASVARYLLWLAIKPVRSEETYQLPQEFELRQSSSAPMVFRGGDPELKTIVGQRSDAGLHTTGRKGNLMHGPFISVAPGSYRVVLKGVVARLGSKQPVAEIAMNSGKTILNQTHVVACNSDALAVLDCEVPPTGCMDFEVRIHVDEHADVTISAVEIEPLRSSARQGLQRAAHV